jgi:CubicO group peptidase (beta-lactamase class C family)
MKELSIDMRSRALQVFSLTIIILLFHISTAYPQNPAISSNSISYFPDDEWTTTTPEEHGMSSTILDEMMQFIEDSNAPIRGLVVTRNGYIVKEQYWNYYTENTTHHIFSCTKSFTGTLIGIAINEGFIDNVSQKVVDFFPEMTIENMDSRKGNMTLEHVLTMTTGLDWNEWNTSYSHADNMYNQMFSSDSPIQFFLNLRSVYDPGTHWVYTTGASHLLSAIVQATTGMSTRTFADEYLFDPLNMTIGGWNVDPQGVNNGGTQLYVTARTMAKLGLLYLNNGTWNGQEILSKDYVTQAITSHANIEAGLDYGYQWWLDTADDTFSARGSEGQYIYVIPAYNIVIAITARADEPGEDISEEVLQYVLNSLENRTGDIVGAMQIVAVTGVVIALAAVVVLYRRRS